MGSGGFEFGLRVALSGAADDPADDADDETHAAEDPRHDHRPLHVFAAVREAVDAGAAAPPPMPSIVM